MMGDRTHVCMCSTTPGMHIMRVELHYKSTNTRSPQWSMLCEQTKTQTHTQKKNAHQTNTTSVPGNRHACGRGSRIAECDGHNKRSNSWLRLACDVIGPSTHMALSGQQWCDHFSWITARAQFPECHLSGERVSDAILSPLTHSATRSLTIIITSKNIIKKTQPKSRGKYLLINDRKLPN